MAARGQDMALLGAVVLANTALPLLLNGGSYLEDSLENSMWIAALSTSSLLLGQVFLLADKPEKVIDAIGFLAAGTLVWALVAILFGAPLTELLVRTFLWALMQSSLTVLQVVVACDTRYESQRMLERILIREHPKTDTEKKIWASFYGATIGAWVGALPILLDWDAPWQAWPFTLVCGSLSGWVIGQLTYKWVFMLLVERRRAE